MYCKSFQPNANDINKLKVLSISKRMPSVEQVGASWVANPSLLTLFFFKSLTSYVIKSSKTTCPFT